MYKRIASVAFFCFMGIALFGCAAQPARITQTANPEVVIKNIDVETVRSKILEVMLSGGTRLDSETPSRLVFSKEMEGFQENLIRATIANSYATPVRSEVAYTIVKIKEGVKVFVQMSAWTQMPGGQIKRIDINNNNDFNAVQQALYRLRDKLNN